MPLSACGGLIVAVGQRREIVRHRRSARRWSRARRGRRSRRSSSAASRTSRANGPIWSSEAGKGDDAVSADAAVGGFEPHSAGQRGRLADGAARVRADRQRRLVCRHGRRRATAAAARNTIEVPRVGRRPVGRELGRRAHRELVHVRLARQHRACLVQSLGDVRVIRADVALQDGAAGGRGVAAGQDQILERDRNAEQRRQRLFVRRTRDAVVGRARLLERQISVPPHPRVQRVVGQLDPIEVGVGQFDGGEITAAQAGGHLARAEARQVGRGQLPCSPRMGGTTK